jgi:hypothetical protein
MRTKSLPQLWLLFTAAASMMVSCEKEAPQTFQSAPVETLETYTIFATGLYNPRGLKFGPDGHLYVAEGGTGGPNQTVGQCEQVPFLGPYSGSPTGGKISKISPSGERTTVSDQFPSSVPAADPSVSGVADIGFCGNDLYALVTGGGCSHGVPDKPNGLYLVKPSGPPVLVANLSEWVKNNPVAAPPVDFQPDGEWYSMVYLNNNFYAMNANQGDFVKISTSGKVTRVADISAVYGHIVPTSVTYCDKFYFGNLNTFPIIQGSSTVYTSSLKGNLAIFEPGYTTILGVAFDKKNRLYVLENTTNNPFPTPGTGRVIRTDGKGNKETIAEGLVLPTAITVGPDGHLYVSNVGFGPVSNTGGGQILKIEITD